MNFASLLMVAAMAAPAMVSGTSLVCDATLSKKEIQGAHLLKKMQSPDLHWCKKECMKVKDCDAVSFDFTTGNRAKNQCSLLKLDSDSFLSVNNKVNSYVFCDGVKCDEMEKQTFFKGGKSLMSFKIKDAWWCRKKCMENKECDAITFNSKSKVCVLLKVNPGQIQRQEDNNYSSYLFCDRYNVLPVCDAGDIVVNGVCDAPEPEEECGAIWGTCCDGQCGDGLVCDVNADRPACVPCGGTKAEPYQLACPGKKCNQKDMRRVVRRDGGCAPCGGMWQDPCDSEPKCSGMMMVDPHSGTQCVMMGAD